MAAAQMGYSDRLLRDLSTCARIVYLTVLPMSCSPESIAWRCPNEPLATISILLSPATALLIAQGVLAGPNAGFVVSVNKPLRVENQS